MVLSFDEEFAVFHDLEVVYPYIKCTADNINMCDRAPRRARMSPVRITECNMTAGDLLVLQDKPADIFYSDVRTDGKLSDAVGVLITVSVF